MLHESFLLFLVTKDEIVVNHGNLRPCNRMESFEIKLAIWKIGIVWFQQFDTGIVAQLLVRRMKGGLVVLKPVGLNKIIPSIQQVNCP